MSDFTLEEWAGTKMDPYALTKEEIEEVVDLYQPVYQKLNDLGVSAVFYFCTKQDANGNGMLDGMTTFSKIERLTPEVLAGHLIATSGIVGLAGGLDDIFAAAIKRYEAVKSLILVPSTK